MAHLVTGYAGEEHIQSADQGSFNASFFGTGQYVMQAGNQFEGSIMDNNTVRILDGDLLMYGRHVRIAPNTYEDLTITTGTAGMNRIDLIVMHYEKNAGDGTETAYLEVIQGAENAGTPTPPSYTNGNILEGETMNQMPLYKVHVEGVVLSEIEAVFETIPTYQALAEQYEEEFILACQTYLGSLNILDSMEQVQANTQPNQLAGGLALKEGINSLATIRTFNVAVADWTDNTDVATSATYPKRCDISSAVYNDDSAPIWQMNGAGTIPTEAERESINMVMEAVFSDEGIVLYATDAPTQALVLEVKGV